MVLLVTPLNANLSANPANNEPTDVKIYFPTPTESVKPIPPNKVSL